MRSGDATHQTVGFSKPDRFTHAVSKLPDQINGMMELRLQKKVVTCYLGYRIRSGYAITDGHSLVNELDKLSSIDLLKVASPLWAILLNKTNNFSEYTEVNVIKQENDEDQYKTLLIILCQSSFC